MRTVYLGTSQFAVTVLRRLADSPHRPSLVLTRPDAPRGRGRRLAPPPVAVAARDLGIEVFQPERVNDDQTVERIAAERPERVALCAFGALVREPLLTRFGAILNVHPSLLPRWRGAAPIERAIMAGDPCTGVSIMALVEEMDAGPVCLAEPEPIRPGDTYGTLSERLAALGGELLVRALDEQPGCVPQPPEGVTVADKITAADRTLDPTRPAADLERAVRALAPHVGARVELSDGSMLGVRAASVVERPPEVPPGRIAVHDGRLLLATAAGALALDEVQPPGGRAMPAADFLRGHGLPS